MEQFLTDLELNGYAILENVLNERRVEKANRLFYEWWDANPDLKSKHSQRGPHGIMKVGEVSHQKFAWYIKTRKTVQNAFKRIWKTDELVTSFDGCCYMSPTPMKDSCWTHTDQTPKGNRCYQGFVSLTENADRTLVVYDKSHLLHEKYMKGKPEGKHWCLIDPDYLKTIEHTKRILHVKAGSLVVWDSRCFHQNQVGVNIETRLVQYVCFMPAHDKLNTDKMHEKRVHYYETRRMTSHWPYPLKVNGKQIHTRGDKSLLVDYSKLTEPDLNNLDRKIRNIL
jgi:hypothetical protein